MKSTQRTLTTLLLTLAPGCDAFDADDQQVTARTEAIVLALEPIVNAAAGPTPGPLFETQLRIVDAAAPIAPVLLLAPDLATKAWLESEVVELSDGLERGSVRVLLSTHVTPWIRDFGPIARRNDAGALVVVDLTYHDPRLDEQFHAERLAVEGERRYLLEGLLADQAPNGIDPDRDEELLRTVDLLGHLTDALETLPHRYRDDSSTVGIARQCFPGRDLDVRVLDVNADAGNLMPLDDGRLLTTHDLLRKNENRREWVDRQLVENLEAEQVIFLEPLPGEVIKHVDMFVLPVASDRLLIASYDPTSHPVIQAAWQSLSPEARALTREAALAMDRNRRRLESLGFEVTEVPAIPPRRCPTGGFYYPSLLNAVTLHGPQREETALLVPFFEDVEEDIQDAAYEVIRRSIPRSRVIPIECTLAAEEQGALHCLTISIPWAGSVFDDPAGSSLVESLYASSDPEPASRWTDDGAARSTRH